MVALFTSNRPLERAENIHAVYDAYDGLKNFVQINPYIKNPSVTSWRYNVLVTDELPGASPGKCVFIGHGMSGGKKYGLDQPYPYFRKENSRLLTYVIATSKDMVELTAKQCGVSPDIVLPYGMPRTDAYFGKRKGDGATFLSEKRSYLFAPTYRTKEETPLPDIDWDYIDGVLTDDEIFVVKRHMLSPYIIRKKYDHIVEVSCDEPSTSYLIDCDVLITDYSTILMDAHILGKPVVLFEKQSGYLETRGMYLDYPYGYASRYCTNEIDLIDCIRSAEKPQKEDIVCRQITAGACDGHSTERVVDLIRNIG